MSETQKKSLIAQFRSNLLSKTENTMFQQFISSLEDDALVGMCQCYDSIYAHLVTPFVDAITKQRLNEAISDFLAKLKSLSTTETHPQ